MQTTGIAVTLKNKVINIYAAYCPPKYNINEDAFKSLGKSSIMAGDFKAKPVAARDLYNGGYCRKFS